MTERGADPLRTPVRSGSWRLFAPTLSVSSASMTWATTASRTEQQNAITNAVFDCFGDVFERDGCLRRRLCESRSLVFRRDEEDG